MNDDKSDSGIKKVGAWSRVSRQCVYENPWIRVDHDEVITPSNTPGIYGVVHFKSVAVGILPIDEENYTWLVRQTRYTLGGYTWEIPEGGAAISEAPLECARRELEEEVGLEAKQWQRILYLHTSNSVTDEQAHVFLATQLSVCPQHLDETEDIQVKKLPFAEAYQMVLSGQITDALSVAAILKYQLLFMAY